MMSLKMASFKTIHHIIITLLKRNNFAYYARQVTEQYRILNADGDIKQKQKALECLKEIFHPKGLRETIIRDRTGRELNCSQWNRLIDAFMDKALETAYSRQ